MGFTSAWAITSHSDAVISELSPRLLPAMLADRAAPRARQRWEQWQQASLPDFDTWYAPAASPAFTASDAAAIESFRELTSPGDNVDEVCSGRADPEFYVVDDVWAEQEEHGIFISVHSKEYAVASFFHALGPVRAALLPGWCGNFLLTSEHVRQSLPSVERALSFTDAERVSAEAQDWLRYSDGEERVLDGPLRLWRAAAREGLGLCGVAVHVC
ncbi:hypothetical protein [Streptomyces sp. NPDC046685]|uniref:hypothetical protein n=1 Tax=Streptomyces sp. NPDC046685 TaxID=3157202 RepID=UPI0033F823FA